MSMYDQDWQDLDTGGDFTLTEEEQAALGAALNGGGNEGDVYGPTRPVSTPSDLSKQMIVRYNDLYDQRARLENRMQREQDAYTLETLSKQHSKITQEILTLGGRINATKAPTAPRPSTITRNNSLYEYTPPGTPGTPGTVNKIFDFPATPSAGDPLGWGNLAARRDEQAWRQLWEPQQAQMTAATSLYGNMANNLMQAVPYMVRPDQEYRTGFEPGSIGEKWAQMNGQTYNPDPFRVNRVNYNPDDIMAQAWKMAAAGVPKPQGGQ